MKDKLISLSVTENGTQEVTWKGKDMPYWLATAWGRSLARNTELGGRPQRVFFIVNEVHSCRALDAYIEESIRIKKKVLTSVENNEKVNP